MAGILDWLGALGTGDALQPSAVQPSAPGPSDSTAPFSSILQLLSAGPSAAGNLVNQGGPAAQPSIPPALEQALVSGNTGSGAPLGFGAGNATPPAVSTANAPGPGLSPASVPTATQDLGPTINVGAGDTSGTAGSSDSNAQTGAGIISAFSQDPAGTLTTAAQDPNASRGLLGSFGDTLKEVGGKLTSLSPNASQALLSAGFSILANNSGRNNLSQLVGLGGQAGTDTYANLQQRQFAQQQAIRQQQIELNKPVIVPAGSNAINPYSGQTVFQSAAEAGTGREYTDQQGNQWVQPTDKFNNAVGQPYLKTPVGAVPTTDQNTAIANAHTSAQQANAAVTLAQQRINQLTPTIPDPNNPGQQIPNPNYVDVSGGIEGRVLDAWTALTGSQSAGQQLANQIRQEIGTTNIESLRASGISRITNLDVETLNNPPPPNASPQALQQYLTAYEHVLETKATQSGATAAYLDSNNGDYRPLRSATTFNGVTYPVGTTYEQFTSGRPPAQQGQQPAAQQQPTQGIARPQTQADYNALPPGTSYIDPKNGQRYRKQ